MAASLFSFRCCWSRRHSAVAQGLGPATEEVTDHQDGGLDADMAHVELRAELRHFHDVGAEGPGGTRKLDDLAALEAETFRRRGAWHAARIDRVGVPGEIDAVGAVPGAREDFLGAVDHAAAG